MLLAVAIAASLWAAMHVARANAFAQEAVEIEDQLQLRVQSLQRLVERYRVLPTVLALDPELKAALSAPAGAVDVDALNRKLEQANGATRVSTLTLIDRSGRAIAANNWRTASSNVGLDYSFRPYFQRAIAQGSGTFYAIGVSTNVAGYYIAEAVRDVTGTPIGVVVVKVPLDALKHEWRESADTLLLSDEHDIVFISNREVWQYRALDGLSATDLDELAASRQYLDQPIRGSRVQELSVLPGGARQVRIQTPATNGKTIWKSMPLQDPQWRLHVLQPDRSDAAALRAALTTLAVWLTLVLLGLFLVQRVRLARHRQRSRAELERMVAHHAQVLRSAQDGLVNAARQATSGEADSLEHLPQGVSVVDAQLRLVAWNSRYQDIFKFPDALLQVGRPIEDIFRHNARRGWLGPGQVDETIQRRLDRLLQGTAHMHERELPDGTVLEIHGNPLPGGGFVTSYADITSYRTAARDLRTLATSLERRIEESTHDLREAKAAAERAHQYKARFVAAAVHDLLQPLNAARMFLGALCDRPIVAEDRALVGRIENALQAQDDLLSSMLDISRLEAGALQPKLEPVALAPMLDELAGQFGILAEARGLQLRCVSTRLSVRTDATLLRRVLQNFLSNALHYTPRGKVLIGCRRRGGVLRIEVWDSGVGIPANKRQVVFEEFQRLDNGMQSDTRSAGLGLSIVERIARVLDHSLDLRSWPGRGSMFAIEVPVAEAHDDAAPTAEFSWSPSSDRPLDGVSVWCVDDDPLALAGIRQLLQGWGCLVSEACGLRSLEVLVATEARPDLILLDYRLGDETGPALLDALELPWRSRPPVIVVSAERDPLLRQRLSEAGFRYLAKPVAPSALRALMTHALLAGRGDRH
jgi:histidine kinase